MSMSAFAGTVEWSKEEERREGPHPVQRLCLDMDSEGKLR